MESQIEENSMNNDNTAATVVKDEPIEHSIEKQQSIQQAKITLPSVYNNNASNEEDLEQQIDECTNTVGQEEVETRFALTKCIFCSKIVSTEDDPKLLECLHAACSSCITSRITENPNSLDNDVMLESVVLCTSCGVNSLPENIIENRFFTKFIDDDIASEEEPKDVAEEEKKCTSCRDNVTATSWCMDCEEFICQNCVMAHQRLKITKDHTIKPKEEFLNETESVKKGDKKIPHHFNCLVHPNEQLSLFCQSCDQLTCRDCQLSDHREHKYKFIHEIAAETRTSVSTLLSEVTYKRQLLKSAMKVIEDRQVLILEKKKNLVQDITQLVVQLTHAISSRGKQLVMRLNDVCDQKQSTLNEKKVALDQISKLTDHCIKFVKFSLEKGSDMELLHCKKSISNHLQRIKSKRADIPNPEIPVRIHLSMDKVQDLIKVISSIGAIVVDGRVYSTNSTPSEPSTPTTPISEPVENKQASSCAVVNTPPMLTQPATGNFNTQNTNNNSFPVNSYINRSMNVPMQQQPMLTPPPPQIPPPPIQSPNQNYLQQQHYNPLPPRSSPQARIPYGINMNYNNRMQQPMMMNQRPGLTNCHQQVTSSTHPNQQQFQMVSDAHLGAQHANLRGLLAPNPPPPAYRPPNNLQYRIPQRYRYPVTTQVQANSQRPQITPQSYQNTSSLLTNMPMRQPPVMQPSQLPPYQVNYQNQPLQQQQSSNVRWHIPPNMSHTVPQYPGKINQGQQPSLQENNYKIMLKSQPTASLSKNNNSASLSNDNIGQNSASNIVSHAVSSSMPKTPSPSSHGKIDETEKSLDKFCQKSLNDLMLTIAKLDSNGIMVIPEAQKNHLDSTQVDSSTDEGINVMTDNSSATSMTKDDPNEDWCAVCMDGGDAVLCCDKCPKVFHLYCHIPNLKAFPHESETWQCMLCTNVLDCSEDSSNEKRPNGMSNRDFKIAQRIVLELYCQYEQSLPFREVVSPEIAEYHKIIKKPMALEIIKEKLKPEHENHYTDLKEVLADIRLMFKNAFTYNQAGSVVFQEAKSLEEFFEKLLLKWAPQYAYDDPFISTEAEDVYQPNRKYRRIIND